MREATNRKDHKWCHRMSATISQPCETVLTIIGGHYRPMRHAAKIAAQHAQTSHLTVKKWLAELCSPNAETLVDLMAGNQAIELEILRLVAERRAARR